MPTREELEAVQARIEDLTGKRFWAQGEFLRPVIGGAPEAGTPWFDLDFEDRREAIYVNTDWTGFSLEEQMAITDVAAEGESYTFFWAALGDDEQSQPIAGPTREQRDAVSQKIGWLESMSYDREEGRSPAPVSDTAMPWWEDLSREEQQAVLVAEVDWEGFTESQRDGVISRVLEGDEPEHWMNGVNEDSDRPIRPLTQQLIECCQLDVWPGRATVIDFGLDTSSHLGALQYAIREGLVTPQELDAAMGKGEKLTEIAQRGENPYRFVTFRTAWDDMPPEMEEYPTPEEADALAAELRADEHAARVRDYGEADTATYEQRVAEGAATVRHLDPLPEPVPAEELERALSDIEQQWGKPDERFKAILEGDAPTPETPTNQPERGKER